MKQTKNIFKLCTLAFGVAPVLTGCSDDADLSSIPLVEIVTFADDVLSISEVNQSLDVVINGTSTGGEINDSLVIAARKSEVLIMISIPLHWCLKAK